MHITFTGFTNKNYCMINTARFRLPSGSIITVDRDETGYDIEDNTLNMTWSDCYIWAIDGENIFDEPAYLNEDAEELFEGATLIGLDLEDDADEDYKVEITEWGIN